MTPVEDEAPVHVDHALRETLLPCPFCGGEASGAGYIRYNRALDDTTWEDGTPITEAHYVNCVRCGAVSRSGIVGGYQTMGEAVAAWNTRATRAPAPIDQKTRELVIAARELWDRDNVCGDELHAALDRALEPFSEAVPYADEPAPIDNEALVEEVARAIDDLPMRSWQAHYDFCVGQGDGHDTAKRYADLTHGADIEKVRERARAVLALPSIASSLQKTQIAPALVEEAIRALERQHNWHLEQTTPDPEYGYIPADEYADSSLCEETLATLAKLKEGRA